MFDSDALSRYRAELAKRNVLLNGPARPYLEARGELPAAEELRNARMALSEARKSADEQRAAIKVAEREGKDPATLETALQRLEDREATAQEHYDRLRGTGIRELSTPELEQLLRSFAPAEGSGLTEGGARAMKDETDDQVRDAVNNTTTSLQQFEGFGFSIGPALKAGGRREVRDAELVDGVVRVTSARRAEPLLLLSTHYLFTPYREFFGIEAGRWGFGPWVGVTFSDGDEILDTFGLGMVLSFRYGDDQKSHSSSAFGIGVGALYDDSVDVLGVGVAENQAAPAQANAPLIRQTSDWAFVVMFNFSFSF